MSQLSTRLSRIERLGIGRPTPERDHHIFAVAVDHPTRSGWPGFERLFWLTAPDRFLVLCFPPGQPESCAVRGDDVWFAFDLAHYWFDPTLRLNVPGLADAENVVIPTYRAEHFIHFRDWRPGMCLERVAAGLAAGTLKPIRIFNLPDPITKGTVHDRSTD